MNLAVGLEKAKRHSLVLVHPRAHCLLLTKSDNPDVRISIPSCLSILMEKVGRHREGFWFKTKPNQKALQVLKCEAVFFLKLKCNL